MSSLEVPKLEAKGLGQAVALPLPAPRPRRQRGFWILVGLFLTLVCVVMLSPFIWTIMSVTKPTDVAFANPPVFAYQPTMTAFVDLWQTTDFYKYLINTIVVAVISTIVALAIGLPAAYALSRFPGWVSAVLLVLALIFRALPRFAVVLPMYEITKSIGIYDTTYALALALIAINQPFTIWLLRNFFAEIPDTLDEAAMIDGCTRFQVLRRVMIPLMGPGILTAGIFVFLFAFQEYLTALILTDVNAKTVPVFIATQLGQTLPMLQQAGAAAMLLTLPVVAIAFIAQKYLVAGLNAGAVKGVTPLSDQETPVVLLPGMNCSARLWAGLDLGPVTAARLTEPTLTGQVDRLLDELPPRFALVGLSLGAIVAMALTRTVPERVASLTLLSTNPYGPTEGQLAGWRRERDRLAAGVTAREVQQDLLPLLLTVGTLESRPDVVEDTLLMADEVGETDLDAQLRLQATRIDERPGLRAVRCPTLVLAARHDRLCPVERHTEIAALVPGARLQVLERAGHLSPLERPLAVRTHLPSR